MNVSRIRIRPSKSVRMQLVASAATVLLCANSLHGQTPAGLLVTRTELTALAARADSLKNVGDEQARQHNSMLAASVRQRLRDGDFQIGDRVVVKILSDTTHIDTVTVRSGKVLELPDKIMVSVGGVLRSELRERVSTEVLKYVKAREIEVTPLMRVAILGEVTRPGYFAFASDLPLTDAIMGAGGPTVSADLQRSIVRRANGAYRSAEETRTAIARGLTLDQFGLAAGDELVVGRRRDINPNTVMGLLGAAGSLLAVFVALSR